MTTADTLKGRLIKEKPRYARKVPSKSQGMLLANVIQKQKVKAFRLSVFPDSLASANTLEWFRDASRTMGKYGMEIWEHLSGSRKMHTAQDTVLSQEAKWKGWSLHDLRHALAGGLAALPPKELLGYETLLLVLCHH